MVGYDTIEGALRERIIEHFAPLITDERCQVADIDAVFGSISRSETGSVGCILDFGGGAQEENQPFTKSVFQWTLSGYFIIRYDNNPAALDATVRTLVSRLTTMLTGEYARLGGCSLARIGMIDQPEPGEINDMPFYWLFFTVEALDK